MKPTLLLLIALAASAAASAQSFPEPGVTPPKILNTPGISVPDEAKRTGLGGKVDVVVKVSDAGIPLEVIRVSGPGWVCPDVTRADVVALRTAAADAAMQTEFAPAEKDGKTREYDMRVSFDFPAAPLTVKGDKIYSAASEAGPRTISMHMPGKATSMPAPAYPPAARAVRASGAVNIQVLIAEDGKVFSAEPVSGHPLLRSAARDAACKAVFQPTTLSGQPVKVSGIVTYNFVP